MADNRAPWWDRGSSANATFGLSVLFVILAVLNFTLAFGNVISKALWETGFVWLVGGIIFLMPAVARRWRIRK